MQAVDNRIGSNLFFPLTRLYCFERFLSNIKAVNAYDKYFHEQNDSTRADERKIRFVDRSARAHAS